MAAPTFGVTASLLEERFVPAAGVRADPASETQVTTIITEVAADFAQKLRAVRLEPDQITTGRAPDAYTWCQTTIAYGVVAEWERRLEGGDLVRADAWEEKFRRRLAELAADPRGVLGDFSTAAPQATAFDLIR